MIQAGPGPAPEGAGGALRLEIAVDQLRPNPHQPRRTFDPEGLAELRESIRRHGLLQPLVVRRASDGFELIAGERRWRAAKAEGLTSVPAVVREGVSDSEMLELALVENVQRRDLDALEKARGYERLMKELGLTQEQVAARVGLKRATVANHLRLLELPEPAQEALIRGIISMGHARALLALKEPDRAQSLLDRIAREGLSVRQVEDAVRFPTRSSIPPGSLGRGGGEPQAGSTPPPWALEIQRRLQEALSARVILQNRAGFTGHILIEYHGQEELNRLIDQLAPRRRLE